MARAASKASPSSTSTPISRRCAICSAGASSARRSIRRFTASTITRNSAGLIEKLAELDMFLNLQVEHDQLATVRAMDRGHAGPRADRSLRPADAGRRNRGKPAFRRCCGSRDRARQRQAVRLFEIFAVPIIRSRIRGRLCAPSSMRSRSTIAYGRRTGRSCARRCGRTTGRWSNSPQRCFPTRPTVANCSGKRRKGCWGSATTLLRHPEVRAKRASKDGRPSPFEACATRKHLRVTD